MIVKKGNIEYDLDDFDDAAAYYGGYVIPLKKGDPLYDNMAMINKYKELGRPLTEEESNKFIIGYYSPPKQGVIELIRDFLFDIWYLIFGNKNSI